MTSQQPAPSQLRLIVETDDFDEAVTFYRDVLGLAERPAFATEGDDRVAILDVATATIEIASTAHARAIDEVEGAPSGTGPRIALEVADTAATLAATAAAGAATLAPPVRTPFHTINARVAGPAGWRVTFFQELATAEERAARPGFSLDADRPH